MDCPRSQDKGTHHNQEVKQLERFMKNLTAKGMHRKNLPNLVQHGNTGNTPAPVIILACLG